METVFMDIGIILSIAIGIAFLAQVLKQPLIISYILTGIICGPFFLNLINSEKSFYHSFAQFGVILLLFLVGLSLNPEFLKKIGRISFVAGVGQVIFTALIGFFLLIALGFSPLVSFYLAVAITFSSTIIIIKLLSDKKDLRSVYGRYTVGLMLVQDIIAIFIMIILSSFGLEKSLFISLFLLFIKGVIIFSVVYFLARVVLPVVLDKVAESTEFLFVFTLGWCFALAGLGEWSGLSLEVGAIIAGLSLGTSKYQTEIFSRLKPLRDFFLVLFFIILGSQMQFKNFSEIYIGLAITLFVLVGNPLILYFLFRRMKFTRRNSFLAGLTAAQVSEFGFVLLFIAQAKGYIGADVLSIFTIVTLATIFISSYLIIYNEAIFKFINPFLEKFGRDKNKSDSAISEKFAVLVFGYHRLGWKICEALKEMNISFAVIDFDPGALKKLEDRHLPHYFGDATDVEFLSELPIDSAKLIISTLPDADDQITLIKHIRQANKKTMIIANLSHSRFLDDVYKAGANYIIMPHLISGEWMCNILKNNSWDKKTFSRLSQSQKDEMKLRFTLGHH